MTVGSSGRRRAVSGALALAALAAGGCSGEAGAAAVVDGRAISVAELHTATEELGRYVDVTPAGVLVALIAEPTVQRAAAEHGVAVSDQQARDLLGTLVTEGGEGEGGGEPAQFGEGAVSVARFTLLQQGLQELPDGQQVVGEVAQTLTELDVDVNPRYGQLDLAAGGITPVVHPWLVPEPADGADGAGAPEEP